MRNVINEYLSQFDLDVRKSNDARFMDQKCTPDVVCFIADSVINTVIDVKKTFTVMIYGSLSILLRMRKLYLINHCLPIKQRAMSMTNSYNSHCECWDMLMCLK